MNFFKRNEDNRTAQETGQGPQQEWVRRAAMKAQVPQGLMTSQELKRTREAKRLAETKMGIMEESVRQLREQQEWLRRYTDLSMQLKEEKACLFKLYKEQSTHVQEEKELLRYESFECVQGNFLRMLTLGRLAADNRRNQSELDRKVDELQHKWEEQHKQVKMCGAELEAASKRLYEAQDVIAQVHHTTGQLAILDDWFRQLESVATAIKARIQGLEQEIAEQTEENELCANELDRHRAGRQSIEMHERMIKQKDGVLARLDRLAELEETIRERAALHKSRLARQTELNERLGNLFNQYQDVNAQLATLGDELASTRRALKGKSSYQLQENAMNLKSRKQLLLSALSLWNRIWAGYEMIEEKRSFLNSLRLKIDHNQANVATLTSETDRLRRLCKEKEYTYLLSKSQNVIKLRGDLKEGVSCSLCGATHHPYHCDTMLEQSKIIGELKTELEMMEAELKQKESLLLDLRMELSEMQGQRKAEEKDLLAVTERQEKDVKEWQLYSSMDNSFKDCTPSTNREARQSMIRQLIENTSKDATDAQERLDRFNYRQSYISELSEKIVALEQRKNELNVALNELNTSCQVMAGQVEFMQDLIEKGNKTFQQVYEEVNALMTLPDWFSEWNRSHEGLRMRIMKLADGWKIMSQNIESNQSELLMGQLHLADLKKEAHTLHEQIDTVQSYLKAVDNRRAESTNQIEQLMGKTTAKCMTQDLFAGMTQARQRTDQEMELLRQMQHDMDASRGRLEAYVALGNEIGDEYARQQQALDLWIHNYNSQHPPIQYSELEQLFQQAKDWTPIRKALFDLRSDIQLRQARVDQLQAELTVMQTEPGSAGFHASDLSMERIITQRQEAEEKLHELIMQIARLQIALDNHEQATFATHPQADAETDI